MTLKDVHTAFFEKVVRGLELLTTEVFCPVGDPMIVHSTHSAIYYLEEVREIPEDLLNVWRGATCVDPAD